MRRKTINLLTRTVDYHGMRVTVPKMHGWLAVNANGTMHSFNAKPKPGSFAWHGPTEICFVGTVDLEGQDWQKTLQAV